MADPFGLVLRVLHILCGILWAGAAVLLAAFIEPAVARMGPEGGKFMKQLMDHGRLNIYMSVTGLVTAVTGVLMLGLASGTGLSVWMGSAYGRAILLGSALGLAGFVWGISVNAPTGARLGRLAGELQAAGGPPGEAQLQEIARLKARLHRGGVVSAILLGLSVVGMAAARHL